MDPLIYTAIYVYFFFCFAGSNSHVYFLQPTVRSCPPLSRPPHGFLRCNNGGTSFRAECQAGCERGYRLEGDSRLTCQANSQWSGPQPRCVGKPSSPPNLYLTTCATSDDGKNLVHVVMRCSVLSLSTPAANGKEHFLPLFKACGNFSVCILVFVAHGGPVSKCFIEHIDLISKARSMIPKERRPHDSLRG